MTDTTKTRVQLVTKAAQKIPGVIASGQSLESEDQELIDGQVDPLILQLSSDEICEVSDDGAIPSEWFDALATLLANLSGPDFGRPFDPAVKTYAENMLRRINSVRATKEPQTVDYF